MRILAAIRDPQAVRAILESLGLPSRPPRTNRPPTTSYSPDPGATLSPAPRGPVRSARLALSGGGLNPPPYGQISADIKSNSCGFT
jgi:hypothetical protein